MMNHFWGLGYNNEKKSMITTRNTYSLGNKSYKTIESASEDDVSNSSNGGSLRTCYMYNS